VIAGFRKCGIRPFNPIPILDKLPSLDPTNCTPLPPSLHSTTGLVPTELPAETQILLLREQLAKHLICRITPPSADVSVVLSSPAHPIKKKKVKTGALLLTDPEVRKKWADEEKKREREKKEKEERKKQRAERAELSKKKEEERKRRSEAAKEIRVKKIEEGEKAKKEKKEQKETEKKEKQEERDREIEEKKRKKKEKRRGGAQPMPAIIADQPKQIIFLLR
jgi:hypothetical protein